MMKRLNQVLLPSIGDSFGTLLEVCVKSPFVPHRSVPNLMHNQYTKRALLLSYLFISTQSLGIAQMLLPALHPTWNTNLAVLGVFYGLDNNPPWNLMSNMLYWCGIGMHICMIRVSTSNKLYEGFRLVYEMHTKNWRVVAPLRRVLSVLWPIYMWMRLLAAPFFLPLTSYDAYKSYGHTPYFLPKLIIFEASQAAAIYYTLTIAMLWYTMLFAATGYLSLHYRHINKRLRAYRRFKVIVWWSVMQQLTHLNGVTDRLSRQTSALSTFFYYLMLITLDGLLFLLVDRRTHPLLRVITVGYAIFALWIAAILFTLYTTVHRAASNLVPLLQVSLHRCHLSPRARLQLDDLKAQLTSDRVGITCAGIFTFTTTKLCRMVINFTLNFILMINLFENYFLWVKDPYEI